MPEFVVTKRVFYRAVRSLRPDITKADFDRMWASYVEARDKHYKLKASLRVIQGGKQ